MAVYSSKFIFVTNYVLNHEPFVVEMSWIMRKTSLRCMGTSPDMEIFAGLSMGAIIKGKNLLSLESKFFHVRIAPI